MYECLQYEELLLDIFREPVKEKEIKPLYSIMSFGYLYPMEQTNSLYFEHKGTKYTATVKEDITTEPKILLICPNETDEPAKEIKFELHGSEWVGPQSLQNEFPETYQSLLKAIKVTGYL